MLYWKMWHFDNMNQILRPSSEIQLNHYLAFPFVSKPSYPSSLRMEQPRLCSNVCVWLHSNGLMFVCVCVCVSVYISTTCGAFVVPDSVSVCFFPLQKVIYSKAVVSFVSPATISL